MKSGGVFFRRNFPLSQFSGEGSTRAPPLPLPPRGGLDEWGVAAAAGAAVVATWRFSATLTAAEVTPE